MNFPQILAGGLIIGLGAYALATLIAWERGPWGVFEMIRGWPKPGGELDYLLSCEACQVTQYATIITLLTAWQQPLAQAAVWDYVLCWLLAIGVGLFLGRKSVIRR